MHSHPRKGGVNQCHTLTHVWMFHVPHWLALDLQDLDLLVGTSSSSTTTTVYTDCEWTMYNPTFSAKKLMFVGPFVLSELFSIDFCPPTETI